MAKSASSIRPLDLSTLPDQGVIFFAGKTGCGKTSAILHVLYSKRDVFDRAIVMCPSVDTCDAYAKHIPDICIFEEFQPKRLEAIYDQQDKDRRLHKLDKRHKVNRILIILDDLAYLKNELSSCKILNKIFFNGRHNKIMLMMSMQDCKCLGPGLRDQHVAVFLGSSGTPPSVKRVYDVFNNVNVTPREFQRYLDRYTVNYTELVITNYKKDAHTADECYCWFKARRGMEFHMCKNAWPVHQNMYDREYFLRR